MWALYALLSAIFAALTSILAKIGIAGISSDLATAIRTGVVLAMAWLVCFAGGTHAQLGQVNAKNWAFLILSGLATGASWLFYFRALQEGEASKVIPIDKSSVVIGMALAFIVLREPVTLKALIGGALVAIGTLVIVL